MNLVVTSPEFGSHSPVHEEIVEPWLPARAGTTIVDGEQGSH
jgi:hypothetical protein